MPYDLTIHFDNADGLIQPHLTIQYEGGGTTTFAATGNDGYGLIFQATVTRPQFRFRFQEASAGGRSEPDLLERDYTPLQVHTDSLEPDEIWCSGTRAFVYHMGPRPVDGDVAEVLAPLSFPEGLFCPDTDLRSGLGANVLSDGRVLFALYHPNAARVYLMGSFNGWQRPGHDTPEPGHFLEMGRYTGYFGVPNIWMMIRDDVHPGEEYKFMVHGGVPRDRKGRLQQYVLDPYARRLDSDRRYSNGIVVDPTRFTWNDHDWTTPDPADLVIYELSVYGFTEQDPDIALQDRGRFSGITARIEQGYFERLGANVLSLMPLAEVPTKQGPRALGYDPSLFCTVERDFGLPDDLRTLVDTAHQQGLAVLIDQVFNHTSNVFNPLWKNILEHPDEEGDATEGGLYFSGATPWGNRIATEKREVQNYLIDACKLWITEYHVDGFRFDATHAHYMDHGFLHRLADELKAFKPDVLLVAENLPNQADLNRQGFDGFAQWCDPFHDKLKALLREGPFEGNSDGPDGLGDVFYFSRRFYAAHTNNVVNYVESHDEHSVAHEVSFSAVLNNPAAQERKSRLGLMASVVALGQPMLYMGQEFGVSRPRNLVTVDWPADLDDHAMFNWVAGLLHLRRRYPGLRLRGYDPDGAGQFAWVLGPWMAPQQGGGRRVIGWRTTPDERWDETLLVMLNFEPFEVEVDVSFGQPGSWVKLADINRIHDIPPRGTNAVDDPTALHAADGLFNGFILPSSSAFIYKWMSP